MTFYIDAWLDHPQPFVQVKNKNNQQVVARFAGSELSKALEHGDFCLSDFCDPRAETQMELVKSLLLLRCCEDIGKEVQEIYGETFTLSAGRSVSEGRNDNVVAFPSLCNDGALLA